MISIHIDQCEYRITKEPSLYYWFNGLEQFNCEIHINIKVCDYGYFYGSIPSEKIYEVVAEKYHFPPTTSKVIIRDDDPSGHHVYYRLIQTDPNIINYFCQHYCKRVETLNLVPVLVSSLSSLSSMYEWYSTKEKYSWLDDYLTIEEVEQIERCVKIHQLGFKDGYDVQRKIYTMNNEEVANLIEKEPFLSKELTVTRTNEVARYMAAHYIAEIYPYINKDFFINILSMY